MKRIGTVYFPLLVLASMTYYCAPKEFSTLGYRHPTHKYSVPFSHPNLRSFMTEDWKVDNYTYTYTAQKFERKWESRYRGELPFDRNSDSVPKPEKTFYSDLMLRHFRSEGTIWICTRDLMPKQSNLRLKVFFDNYVHSLISNERMLCGDVFGYQTQKPIFSARVLEHKRTELTPYSALEATMVLDDPRIYTPNPVEGVGKIRVVMAKINSQIKRWISTHEGGKLIEEPGQVLMIVGYFNIPADFDKYEADFDSFLEQIYFAP